MSTVCMVPECSRPAAYHLNPHTGKPSKRHRYCEPCWEDALRRSARSALNAIRKQIPAQEAFMLQHGGIKRYANSSHGHSPHTDTLTSRLNR